LHRGIATGLAKTGVRDQKFNKPARRREKEVDFAPPYVKKGFGMTKPKDRESTERRTGS